MSQYSPFFEVIHDEQKPVGFLGRGTHYSVFQYPSWVADSGSPLSKPRQHRFSVVWDEDHDTRVIRVLERLYLAGALESVMFIGERKGMLTAVLFQSIAKTRRQELQATFESVASFDADTWTVELFSPGEASGIISDETGKVSTYLSNIENIWQLGVSTYS